MDSLVGYPGSALCAPMDHCGKAVVSQNHETGIRMREKRILLACKDESYLSVKRGGIRESIVSVPGPKQPTSYNIVVWGTSYKEKDAM